MKIWSLYQWFSREVCTYFTGYRKALVGSSNFKITLDDADIHCASSPLLEVPVERLAEAHVQPKCTWGHPHGKLASTISNTPLNLAELPCQTKDIEIPRYSMSHATSLSAQHGVSFELCRWQEEGQRGSHHWPCINKYTHVSAHPPHCSHAAEGRWWQWHSALCRQTCEHHGEGPEEERLTRHGQHSLPLHSPFLLWCAWDYCGFWKGWPSLLDKTCRPTTASLTTTDPEFHACNGLSGRIDLFLG